MSIFGKLKSSININTKSYSGNNVSIINGKIFVDGKKVDTDNDKNITISINGNVDNLEIDSCDRIEITGNVTTLKNGSGDVKCKDVEQNITSGSGDVECDIVKGNIITGSGDVNCRGSISGNVKTGSGDVKYSKSSNIKK